MSKHLPARPSLSSLKAQAKQLLASIRENDPEGRLITQIRELLGDLPLVVSLDLHAVITDRLVEAADVLVPYHTYPHTDQYETGWRAARNLLRLMAGETRPTLARVRLPARSDNVYIKKR